MKKILLLAAAAAALLVAAGCQKPGRDDVTIDEGFVWAAANVGARDTGSLGSERFLKNRPMNPPKGYRLPTEDEWLRLYESCTWTIEANGRAIFASGTSKTTGERIFIPLEKDRFDLYPSGSYAFDKTYVSDGVSDYRVMDWRFFVEDCKFSVEVAYTSTGDFLYMTRYIKD